LNPRRDAGYSSSDFLLLVYSTHCGETQFVVGGYLRKSREKLVAELLHEISLSELLNSDLSMGVLSVVDLEQLLTFSPEAHNFVSHWISRVAVESNLVRL
jgi:coenzyme F420-reducing hydrogenase delta subunit